MKSMLEKSGEVNYGINGFVQMLEKNKINKKEILEVIQETLEFLTNEIENKRDIYTDGLTLKLNDIIKKIKGDN